MAQIGVAASALVGRGIGGFVGGPLGAAVGGVAGGLIGSFIFNRAQKPLIPDWQMASSSFGHPISIVYGQAKVPGNFIWESGVTTKSHGLFGGKGLGGQQSQNSYYQSAAAVFCEGPATLLKIWLDGKLFYDTTSANPHELTGRGGGFAIRTYSGDEAQMPDVEIADWVHNHALPADACPAYRGLSYIVMHAVDLAAHGMRMPSVAALMSTNATATTIFKTFERFSTDASTGSAGAVAVTADWGVGLAYQLASDGVRAYNIQSGQQTAKGPSSIPGDPAIDGASPPAVPIRSIAAGDSTYLYATTKLHGGGFGVSYFDVLTIDPGSLAIRHQVRLFGSGGAFLVDHFLGRLIATRVQAPFGTFDLVAGTWFVGALPIIINPDTGAWWEVPSPVGSGTAFGGERGICWGKNEPVTGDVDLWITVPSNDGVTIALFQLTLKADQWTHVRDPSFTLDQNENLASTLVVPPPVHTFTSADFGTTGPISGGLSVAYDASDNSILIGSVTGVAGVTSFKWRDGAIVWTSASTAIGSGNTNINLGTVSGGWGGGSIGIKSSATGTDTGSPVGGSVIVPAAGVQQIWDSYSKGLLYWGSDGLLHMAYTLRTGGGLVNIADIIADLCARVDIAADMIDVSDVTQQCVGYVVQGGIPASQAIADLCQSFHIDIVESDYRLKFIPRGGVSVVDLVQANLAPLSPQDQASYWQETRAQEQEMPLQINVRWIDPDIDYQPNTTYAKRVSYAPVRTQFARRVQTVDLPVITDLITARRIAESWLFTLWAERTTYQTGLGLAHLWLDPGDMVRVTMENGDFYQVRIEQFDMGADWAIHATMSAENATTYAPNSSTTRGGDVSFVPQTMIPDAFAELAQFNIPLLQDSDDLGGTETRIYYAALPSDPANTTIARLFRSTDGSAYPQFDSITGFPDWGRPRAALGTTAAPFTVDFTNTLTITLGPGVPAPSSCSYDDMMNGANAALVGQEVIQFQTVADNADGSITISTLLRARRGTEWAVGGHVAGELFILLVAGEIKANRLTLSEIGQLEYYKLVPAGRFIDQMPTNPFTYLGYDLMPYAPVQLARAPDGGNVTLSWIRRTRIGGLLLDGTDTAPLGEASERYDAFLLPNAGALAAFDPDTPATYRRAFLVLSSPTVSYTAAMMTADGVTPATDTLYLVVYQRSIVVGRGFQAYAALPPF